MMSQMYGGLFTQTELNTAQAEGLVRSNVHPNDPELWILNYTEKAAFDSVWNNVTLNCRGLIVNAFGDIIARAFPKFFNYGQAGCPEINLDEPAIVSDKLDGSLGILYPHPEGGYAIATRGSFTSDQAIHATEILKTKYADYIPPGGVTMLFEIIYPENRIVCDYGDMDDLVLLGSVHNASGDSWEGADVDWDWPGPVGEIFEYSTMREALEAEPRPGKEGFVVHFYLSGNRVKIKQEDYIQLHRIVTGLNARSVWEAMLYDEIDELIEKIPDEFHDFIRSVESHLSVLVWAEVNYAHSVYDQILLQLGDNPSKKEFAMIAKDHSCSWALFQLYDNKDIRKEFLRRAKPAHNYSPIKVSNDAD